MEILERSKNRQKVEYLPTTLEVSLNCFHGTQLNNSGNKS